jgi:hypothetical protein
MGKKSGSTSRQDILSALSLIILFFAALTGREIGNIYSSFEEMQNLKVLFEVSEEELAVYLSEVLNGEDAGLDVGLTITLPQVSNEEGIITDTPDYVRRWLISITLSPMLVRQPSVSDVELKMYVSKELVISDFFEFEKRKVSYLDFTDREIKLEIEDLEMFRSVLEEAANNSGGEVEVSLKGTVLAHLLWLETWLPFEVTRYPLLWVPSFEYVSSEWKSLDNVVIDETGVETDVYVSLIIMNPMRFHSIRKDITCTIFDDQGTEFVITKEVSAAPQSSAEYVFLFNPKVSGEFSYSIESSETVYVERVSSKILKVSQ